MGQLFVFKTFKSHLNQCQTQCGAFLTAMYFAWSRQQGKGYLYLLGMLCLILPITSGKCFSGHCLLSAHLGRGTHTLTQDREGEKTFFALSHESLWITACINVQ